MEDIDDYNPESCCTSETYEEKDEELAALAKAARLAQYLARKGRRLVYVGNLPNYTPKAEIINFFSQFGIIENTVNEKSHSYITFSTSESADLALDVMNDDDSPLFNGRSLLVGPGIDTDLPVGVRMVDILFNVPDTRRLLYCRGLPENTKLQDMARHFSMFGRVTAVWKEAFFGFITFESNEDAARALEILKSSRAPRFEGSRLVVEWANWVDGLELEGELSEESD